MAQLLASLEKALTKLRRKRVSRQVFDQNQGQVRYGPFKGLSLAGAAHTSAGNLGGKSCGLYEQCVIDKIMALGPFQDVVNLGAGDGYFALGLLKAQLAKRSICFEMDATGREQIARNAKTNGVSDQIEIFGIADDTTGAQLAQVGFEAAQSLVLCDIEGAEFSVLTKKMLSDLAGATFVIELHDKIMPDGAGKRQALIDRFPEGAKTSILKSSPANWQDIPEIEALSDNDRSLVASDGRKVLGEWLIVTF